VLLCQGDAIEPEHLPVERMRATRPAPHAPAPSPPHTSVDAAPTPREHPRAPTGGRRPASPTPPQDEALDFRKDARERERKQIIAALKTAEGNQSKAAKILGISRRTLLTKLDVHKLPRPRKRP
jgi:DNA-binding NtrC family response regulator